MKAFIFDLDGVIVFTDKFHYLAWKKMADEMGIYFDETINKPSPRCKPCRKPGNYFGEI